VACGTGLVALEAVRAVRPHGVIVAVDFSSQLVEAAKRQGLEPGLSNVTYARMDAQGIELSRTMEAKPWSKRRPASTVPTLTVGSSARLSISCGPATATDSSAGQRGMAVVTFRLEQDFPTELARLWAVLGRRDFVEQKYQALGSTALHILKFDASERMIEVELERRVPATPEEMPAWARVLSGVRQTMHHHTRWERVSPTRIDAEVDISPVGKPVRVHGIGTVVELSPDRTRMTLDFNVECNVPAIGPKVARLFADQMKQALREDHRFTLNYLAGRVTAMRQKDVENGTDELRQRPRADPG
jgi:predicted RNA methylase